MGLLNFEWMGGQKRESGGAPLLQVEHLSVRIGQRLVLDDVSLEVFEGEQVRITGPNGAGKSTLLNAITGVLPLNEGRILFKGEDISKLPTHERTARGICYMRQRDNVLRIGNSTAQIEVSMTATLRSMPIFIVEFPQKIRIPPHPLVKLLAI